MQNQSEAEDTTSAAAPNDVESRPLELQEEEVPEASLLIIEDIVSTLDLMEKRISSKIDRIASKIDRIALMVARVESRIDAIIEAVEMHVDSE